MRKEKTCGDCLYCKMTILSLRNDNLCFCEKKIPREYKPEPYWLKKILVNFLVIWVVVRK